MEKGYEYISRAVPDPDVQYPLIVKYCGGTVLQIKFLFFLI